MSERPIGLGVRRGLRLKCPQCGEGRLFRKFLKVSDHCDACGADNTVYPCDDAPPYLALFLVGHLLMPFIVMMSRDMDPPIWLMASIWLPLTLICCVVALPYMKGLVVGFAWATGVKHPDAET